MPNTQNEIFSKGDKAPTDYFSGTAWVRMILPNHDQLHCQIGNVTFEPGARNNWHLHPGGQILIVTEGKGYYQQKGKPIQLIQKGDVVAILPDVVHWHGASAECQMTHMAINPNTQKGIVDWMERVNDADYGSYESAAD